MATQLQSIVAEGGPPIDGEPQINALLRFLVEHEGSDLHLMCGAPAKMRLHGDLHVILINGEPLILTPEMTRGWVYEILDEEHIIQFEQTGDTDLAYRVPGCSRFRVNILEQINGPGAVFRAIPETILTLEQLMMPPVLKSLAEKRQGLVVVTGPTGSGKSTTLAAMINHINHTRGGHIVTIEDPVEFVHENVKSRITHREIGAHTNSFASALKVALRQDPNVILVGEMRDLETIQLALTAADPGVMVYGTLHTNTAVGTVNRVIDVFTYEQQNQIRALLSENLTAVVAQTLLKTADGKGRCAAVEIMVVTSGIRGAIRENKIEQIDSMIETGSQQGMQSMDDCLYRMMQEGRVTPEAAREYASDQRRFQ